MKVLIDPVYTAKVNQCSTSYLTWEIIEEMVSARSDVFFYLLVPPDMDEAEQAFVSRHADRVRTFPYPYVKTDRVSELFKLDANLVQYLSPGDSPVWDYDVLLTSRIQQLPYMRNVANRRANFSHGTHRLFLGLEEMPMFSFRDTVPWHDEMDLVSLAAYESAGGIIVNNLWTKTMVTQVARQWLAPSRVMQLTKQMHEAVPVKLQRLKVPAEPKPIGDTFNVVFAGRMTGTRNFKEVADVFRKHYSYPIGTEKALRFIVTTNSQSQGASNAGEIDFMEIQKNNREQFHALLQTTAHVVVNLSTVEDFSLSTYEPLLFGVPVIVPNKPWTSFLGDDYPFRTHGVTEAYAMVKQFADDYAGQMAKFRKWEATTWKRLVEGPKNVPTVEMVRRLMEDHEQALHSDLKGRDAGAMYMALVQELLDTGEEFVKPLEYAKGKGLLTTTAKSWTGIPISLRPSQYLLKVYANLMGLQDTNDPGVMRRV
ncbi:glycosyltransferase [Rhodobacter phage RcZahn]|nr:glycosyltransferase [Rhodobacter phage RcZahn]